jgi:hypothetical protein
MAHEHALDVNEQYSMSGKTRKILFGAMALGAILLLIGIGLNSDQHHRIWATYLQVNFLLLTLGLGGTVFVVINYLANAGWHVQLKRIPEAMSTYLPWAAVFMLPLLLPDAMHSLYHWTHEGIMDPNSENFDPILKGKEAFLNSTFFRVRYFVYFFLWITFAYFIRRFSDLEDKVGGMKYFNKSNVLSAVFIVVFGLSFSLATFDWLMSIDPHWYSTIYAVYCFAGLFVGTATIIQLITLFLKDRGHLQAVTNEHIHDLGKFMFAFSIFWAYIWLSQFLLIWYSNIPEETLYYYERFQPGWQTLFMVNLVLNFVAPFFILMTRDAKRNRTFLAVMIGIILTGRWIDIYLLVHPGAAGEESGFGMIEIGFTLLLGSAYAFIVMHNLAKKPLIAKNHPYLEESVHHEIVP